MKKLELIRLVTVAGIAIAFMIGNTIVANKKVNSFKTLYKLEEQKNDILTKIVSNDDKQIELLKKANKLQEDMIKEQQNKLDKIGAPQDFH